MVYAEATSALPLIAPVMFIIKAVGRADSREDLRIYLSETNSKDALLLKAAGIRIMICGFKARGGIEK